jgi:hypothetical protein
VSIGLVILGAVLVAIAVDILRFPKWPTPTQRQDEEAIFGKNALVTPQMRRFYTIYLRYGGLPRSPQVCALGVILLILGCALAAKGLGVI